MSPGSSTESYPAFAHIELRENPGKSLNQVTCPDRESNAGHLVSRPDVLTVTPQNNARLLIIHAAERPKLENLFVGPAPLGGYTRRIRATCFTPRIQISYNTSTISANKRI
ncbi:hypothetical protein ANN_20053 [Periplaneta americana]|uniref:Uncharacterized protein n=1 Tax=Periplaneta americana TaxID=6978 RepID=A0ABQ8SBS0_PERAM|nr:hypothetical protein ANN_20053 [Periplaneta americana]